MNARLLREALLEAWNIFERSEDKIDLPGESVHDAEKLDEFMGIAIPLLDLTSDEWHLLADRSRGKAIEGAISLTAASWFLFGLAGADSGLGERAAELLRGLAFTDGPKLPRLDDLGKAIKTVLESLDGEPVPRAVWNELIFRADSGFPPFDVIFADDAEPNVLTWVHRKTGVEKRVTFAAFRDRIRRFQKKVWMRSAR